MTSETENFDVIVIGGGPAGSVAAAGLRQAGKTVIIFEKEIFPRFIIGESLLPASNDVMERVGLFDVIKEAGFMKKGGAYFFMGDKIEKFNFAEASAGGWSYAYQVPRDDFDKILIDKTATMGADVRFGAEVTDVRFSDDGASVDVTHDGKQYSVESKYLIDCSGYGRVLPKLLDLDEPSELEYRESLFTHITGDIRPEGAEEGYIWIVDLPQGGWIWVIPFSNGKTSVGVVAKPEVYDAEDGNDEEILRKLLLQEPSLKKRLANMEFSMPAVRIKGYSISIKKLYGDRFIITGNATEFLDPVFSAGVTLAMASADLAQSLIVRALDGEEVDFDREYAEYLMRGVNCFRTYVKGWYTNELKWLFFNDDKPEKIKQKVCSVLAGYVWDENNTFATSSDEALAAAVATVPESMRF